MHIYGETCNGKGRKVLLRDLLMVVVFLIYAIVGMRYSNLLGVCKTNTTWVTSVAFGGEKTSYVRVLHESRWCCMLYVSSPYLLVFGDDHVMCYTRANDFVGGSGEA